MVPSRKHPCSIPFFCKFKIWLPRCIPTSEWHPSLLAYKFIWAHERLGLQWTPNGLTYRHFNIILFIGPFNEFHTWHRFQYFQCKLDVGTLLFCMAGGHLVRNSFICPSILLWDEAISCWRENCFHLFCIQLHVTFEVFAILVIYLRIGIVVLM